MSVKFTSTESSLTTADCVVVFLLNWYRHQRTDEKDQRPFLQESGGGWRKDEPDHWLVSATFPSVLWHCCRVTRKKKTCIHLSRKQCKKKIDGELA